MMLSSAEKQGGASFWRNEMKAMSRLALPMVGMYVAQIAIHTTDVIMLGQLGKFTLGVGSIATSFYFTIWIFCIGVVATSTPFIAQAVGAKDEREVRRSVRQAIWAGVFVSLPLIVIFWYSGNILGLMGQESDVALRAQDYIRIVLLGTFPHICFVVLRGLVSALDKAKVPFYILMGAIFANALLNYGFIFGNFGLPDLGLEGAAISSVLVQWGMFFSLLSYVLVYKKTRHLKLFTRFWVADWEKFFKIFRVGLPNGCILALEYSSFLVAMAMCGMVGENSLAAAAIGNQCVGIAFMAAAGLGQAATVRVGLAAGARNKQAVASAGTVALTLGTGYMALVAFSFLVFPEFLVGFFLDISDPANLAVANLAVKLLTIAAFFQLFDGGQAIGWALLRGINDTSKPALYSFVGYWVIGIPIGYVLGFVMEMGAVGIWIGLGLGLFIVACAAISRFLRRERLGLMMAFMEEKQVQTV